MRTSKIVLFAIAGLFLVFQNCAPVAFDSTELLNDGFNRPVQPNFIEMKAGPDQSFPPLKLVFVVDNSGTMGVNQINLSKAFEKMFEGDNATNLGPFESNAVIINTAQASVDKNDSILARLPAVSVDTIADMNFNDLMTQKRGAKLDGSVPGDLVGYRVDRKVVNGLTSLEYFPAPLTAFSSFGMKSRANQMVHLSRGGDIDAFKKDFQERLALLHPDRSATTVVNGVTTGILDPIVDKESGLCAVARVLKNNSGLISANELAAFVIVTDEDDADPQGARCLDSIKDQSGDVDLYDGRCERPRTQFSYRAQVANPANPKCTVGYRRGFNYSYTYPISQTLVTVYRERHSYQVPRTAITYYTFNGYTHDTYSTAISYRTSAPTYQVPRTQIEYYKEVESCTIRDGIKTNCTYSYPKTTIAVDGSYGSNCAAFVTGKIPSDALVNNATYKPVCTALTPVDRSGPCSASDTDKINCNQNYSNALTANLSGRPASTSASDCAAFVAGKLPAGAVYGAPYVPACGTVTTTSNTVTSGSCPTSGVSNCVNRPLASNSDTVDQTFVSPTTCAQFVKNKKPAAVTDQLATYPVLCTPSTPSAATNAYGVCPTSDINKINCTRNPEMVAARNYDGVIASGKTCLDFVNGLSGLPSNTIKVAGQYEPTCGAVSTRTSGSQNASFLFADGAKYAALNVNPNDACPQDIKDDVIAARGGVTACTIGSALTASQLYDGQTCAMTDVAGYCSNSNGLRKNCVGTDTAAGELYETNPTVATLDGTFTCDTKCSDTSFCTTKPGLVKDNYYACSTTAQSPRTISNFTASNAPTCLAGDVRVDTRGPYRTTETISAPVVDKATSGPDKLAEYIKMRSAEMFGEAMPFVSVFTRQGTDPLGTNGSHGTAYQRFADSMGGQKISVLSDGTGYADALKGLSGMIRERLARSFQVSVMAPTDEIRRVWHRRAGATAWGKPVDAALWTAKGSALTLSKDFPMEYGDEFRIEYW